MENVRGIVVWLIKVILAGTMSILLLSIFSVVYGYSGVHITNETGTTDYKWESGQLRTTMTEGFSWIKMDKFGFNNSEEFQERNIDILLMGSSHMEALQVASEENTGYLLNVLLPGEHTYNIGMSGHTIYHCVKNMNEAVDFYHPSKYVILETDRIELSEISMEDVMKDAYPTIPSYDSGILYLLQKRLPAVKSLYQQIDNWRNVGVISDEDSAEIVDYKSPSYRKLLGEFLNKAKEPIETNGLELIIFYQPKTEINEDGEFVDPTDKAALQIFSEICQEKGIIFIDLTSSFQSLYDTEFVLAHGFSNTSIGEGHLNAEGHRVIAEELAKVITADKAQKGE